jgi:aspartyl-tRNA synthetase
LFIFIFDGIADKYKSELEIISQQYPFEPLQYLRPSLRLSFKEGIDLLREAGIAAAYDEDLSTPQEKALGKIVKEKYGTDFYMMDRYPLAVRPFYTMPCPDDDQVSNSYDLFIRGEEIVSGAQRVHDVNLLVERANHWKIPLASIQSYIDAFKHGALPHAGGGIGLERVVMLYLGLKNIRKTSLFPRDPTRLSP